MTIWFTVPVARVATFISYYNSRSSEIGEVADVFVLENGGARKMLASGRITESLASDVINNVSDADYYTSWPADSGWLGTHHD